MHAARGNALCPSQPFWQTFVSGAPAEARRCAPHFLGCFFLVKFFTCSFWSLRAEGMDGFEEFQYLLKAPRLFFAQLWRALLILAVKPWPLFQLVEQHPLNRLKFLGNFLKVQRKLARIGVLAVTCLFFFWGGVSLIKRQKHNPSAEFL